MTELTSMPGFRNHQQKLIRPSQVKNHAWLADWSTITALANRAMHDFANKKEIQ